MRKFFLAAVLVLMASGAQAVTLDVVGGQLMGASGVLVDGSLYDVQFLDGSCPGLYSGCDSTSDFTFQTSSAAKLASVALLEQVTIFDPVSLIDFATSPTLINGCHVLTSWCAPYTPYRLLPDLSGFYAYGGPVPQGFLTNNLTQFHGWDLALGLLSTNPGIVDHSGFVTMAIWTPVPEPSTAVLLSLGLVGMASYRRR